MGSRATTLVARNLAMAGIVGYWCMAVSINTGHEQEAFNRGAVWVTLVLSVAYFAGASVARRGSRLGELFIRFGGVVLLIGGMMVYTVIASLAAGRVL